MKNVLLLLAMLFAAEAKAALDSVTNEFAWNNSPLDHPGAIARQLLMQGKINEACRELEDRCGKDPMHGGLWLSLMVARLSADDDTGALTAGRIAVQLREGEAVPNLVGLLLAHGQTAEALQLVPHLEWLSNEKASVPAGTKINSLTLLLSYALAKEDRTLAAKYADQIGWDNIRNVGPGNVPALASLEELCNQTGNTQAARIVRQQREKFTETQPANGQSDKKHEPNIFYRTMSGFSKESISSVTGTSRVTYPFPPLNGELAEELELIKSDQSSAAIEQVKKLLAMRPNYARGWRFLGTSYEMKGDWVAAQNCNSNAVMLQDGVAVANLAGIADREADAALSRSLIKHLLHIRDDPWMPFNTRVKAMALMARFGDRINDTTLVREAVAKIPSIDTARNLEDVNKENLEGMFRHIEGILAKRSANREFSELTKAWQLIREALSSRK